MEDKIITSRLAECEEVIERGLNTFVDVGNALLEIRDSKLYRENYNTFEEYCRDRWGWERRHAYRLMDAAKVFDNVSERTQIVPTSEWQARPLTTLEPEEQREAWQRVIETAPRTGITANHVQSVVDEIQNKPHISYNSGENEWYTPPLIINAARLAMGSIDTDPASSDIANELVRANRYYTIQDNGLLQRWFGNVWLNPPYSQPLVAQFADAITLKYAEKEIDQACVLVNNATETGWFQTMLYQASVVCFLKGRVKFIDKYGEASGAPLQGQAVLYFGENTTNFEEQFTELGRLLYARTWRDS